MRVAMVSWMVVLTACVVDHQGLGAPPLDAGRDVMRDDVGPLDVSTEVADAEDVGGDVSPDGPLDECPLDPMKTTPGACGCGVPDTDGDVDGVYACPAADCGIDFACGDCDDDEPAAAPGLAEVCDGLDNDCDGVVDNDPCSGCADGQREGFVAYLDYPDVAGCAGGFELPGVIRSTPTCERSAGDDGGMIAGCTSADLCATGWSLCSDETFIPASPTGCMGLGAVGSMKFFVGGVAGIGCDEEGGDDLYGCGSVGRMTSSCAFTQVVNHACTELSPDWDCGTVFSEATTVTKPGAGSGGVLCCRD